ncbi:hypothetical protein ABZ845_07410 [Streptomyces sp. NPDC047022]|uniref:hypothetical protein n=1 Tax=Streptomyces sp. NPDC047022 TaxID=3155737 RepID=UPI0033ECF277
MSQPPDQPAQGGFGAPQNSPQGGFGAPPDPQPPAQPPPGTGYPQRPGPYSRPGPYAQPGPNAAPRSGYGCPPQQQPQFPGTPTAPLGGSRNPFSDGSLRSTLRSGKADSPSPDCKSAFFGSDLTACSGVVVDANTPYVPSGTQRGSSNEIVAFGRGAVLPDHSRSRRPTTWTGCVSATQLFGQTQTNAKLMPACGK